MVLSKIRTWISKVLSKPPREPTVYDKIQYIKKHQIDYRRLYAIRCLFVYDNIYIYIEELDKIIGLDLTVDKIDVKKLAVMEHELSFLQWLSYNGKMTLEPTEVISSFLDLVQELYTRADLLTITDHDGIVSYNTRIIQAHVIYISRIIDILSMCCEELQYDS